MLRVRFIIIVATFGIQFMALVGSVLFWGYVRREAMKHDTTNIPEYLHHRLVDYEPRYCINCGKQFPIKTYRNGRATASNNRNPRILESLRDYNRKRYCSYSCVAQDRERIKRGGEPHKEKPVKLKKTTRRHRTHIQDWTPPERRPVAARFKVLNCGKGEPLPPTPEQIQVLADALIEHPELGDALQETLTEAWTPWSSATNKRS